MHGQVLSETSTSTGVLGNDSDPDNDSLTASLVSNVLHGTLTFNTNGTFTYTPTAGFFGTDTFTYKDYDGAGVEHRGHRHHRRHRGPTGRPQRCLFDQPRPGPLGHGHQSRRPGQ